MQYNKLYLYLTEALKSLPGEKAQLKMAPSVPFLKENHFSPPIRAGILILIFPFENDWATVLMQRNKYPGVHSGQISFPGGKTEKTDLSILATALREANEEIGIHPSTVKIVGEISPFYIQASNFMVTPVVGISKYTPSFILNKQEVEKLIIAKFKDLYNTDNIEEFEFTNRDMKIKAPCYNINKNIIWGATAMILSEFLEIMKDFYIQK